jgi:Cu+-exporting ATPase
MPRAYVLAAILLTVTRLSVHGMMCESCASKVRTGIQKVPGVHDVTVDARTDVVAIEHEPTATDDQLVTAVRDAGYFAKILSKENEK